MTKEQREAIRGRNEAATGRMTLPLALRIRNECYALLDALEEAESERDEAERAFQAELGLRQKTEANRNQWKLLAEQNLMTAELALAESERWEKRAKALERAIKEYCYLCANPTCKLVGQNLRSCKHFMLNEAWFSGKEEDT